MKDVKVINLTIKQLVITISIIITILTTYAQIKNSSIMKIAEGVKEKGNIEEQQTIKEQLKILARIDKLTKTRLEKMEEQTATLAKREASGIQVITRSALTERQKGKQEIIMQQNDTLEAQQNIQQEEILQQANFQEEELKTEQEIITLEKEQYIEVQENYKTISEVTISKNMDLTVRTGLSKEDFKKLISKVRQDKTKFFYNNSDYIYDLCNEYQLNEIFFCGLISAESGWEIVSSHRNTHNYISLMSKGKLIRYKSVEEGLRVAAQKLHQNYLSENGKYYNGKTLEAVKINFCPNSSKWINLVYSGMEQIIRSR